MKKILFLIHDLGHGGAEKVLVNLVNNMDPEKFNITVLALFGGGVNEQFLKPHIRYITVFKKTFPGNSHLLKLLTPKQLHKWLIKEKYDIEVSYLEGPSARIISGCPHEDTKLVSWIHSTAKSVNEVCESFRTKKEAQQCYDKFHSNVFVSAGTRAAFMRYCSLHTSTCIMFNVNQSDAIIEKSLENIDAGSYAGDEIKLCCVGKLEKAKGVARLINIHKRLIDEGKNVKTIILGDGAEKEHLQKQIDDNNLSESVTLLGYQTNPYKYVSKCDLFVCSSYSEGFSTAATEALIVGTPVCTVEVSGMKEMLGENNEYGLVTENSEESLYEGIKQLIDNPELLAHYKKQAKERAKIFTTKETVAAVEDMLLNL